MKWIDMHCDTLSEAVRKGSSLINNRFCLDINRLILSNSAVQFFACFVDAGNEEGREKWDRGYENIGRMIKYAYSFSGKEVQFLSDFREMDARRSKQKIFGVLTVEEGGVLNGKLERLDSLYDRGIRLMTLTWNYENCIGYPNSRKKEIMNQGLKEFGYHVIERMNKLGMIIDVSHLSDKGFEDCIRYRKKPVAASHSNARSLCRHPRNLSDDMLRMLGENGGVAGLNLYSVFLCENKIAQVGDIAEHALWMIKMGGEDVPAMGTDFDGFETRWLPAEISDVLDMEQLWNAFRKAGLTSRQIDKITYQNVRRVMRDVSK